MMNAADPDTTADQNATLYTEEELQKKIQARLLKSAQEREALRRENAQLQQQLQAQAAPPPAVAQNPLAGSQGAPQGAPQGMPQPQQAMQGGEAPQAPQGGSPEMQQQMFNALSQFGEQQQQQQQQQLQQQQQFEQQQQQQQALAKLQEIEGGDPEFASLSQKERDLPLDKVAHILTSQDTPTAKRILDDLMRKPSEKAFLKAAVLDEATGGDPQAYNKWLAGKVGAATMEGSKLPDVPDHSGETVENPAGDMDNIEDMVRNY